MDGDAKIIDDALLLINRGNKLLSQIGIQLKIIAQI